MDCSIGFLFPAIFFFLPVSLQPPPSGTGGLDAALRRLDAALRRFY